MFYASVTNVDDQVIASFANGKTGEKFVGEPIGYTREIGKTAVNQAMAEIEALNGVFAAIAETGYAGKVAVSCKKGLALKLRNSLAGKEIRQAFMSGREEWQSYCDSIDALAQAISEAGMTVETVPSINLVRTEVEIVGDYDVVDGKLMVEGTEVKDGDEVEFVSVENSQFAKTALNGLLSINDAYCVGKKVLSVSLPQSDLGKPRITVLRFADAKALPDTAYCRRLSWLRDLAAINRMELSDGFSTLLAQA